MSTSVCSPHGFSISCIPAASSWRTSCHTGTPAGWYWGPRWLSDWLGTVETVSCDIRLQVSIPTKTRVLKPLKGSVFIDKDNPTEWSRHVTPLQTLLHSTPTTLHCSPPPLNLSLVPTVGAVSLSGRVLDWTVCREHCFEPRILLFQGPDSFEAGEAEIQPEIVLGFFVKVSGLILPICLNRNGLWLEWKEFFQRAYRAAWEE